MNNKTVGIVAAKSNSKRFPNKNITEIDGFPLFYHSVLPLLYSNSVDDVYVATDSDFIKEYCEKKQIKVIWRNCNATHDEESLLDVLRFAYKTIDKSYDNIITIMANCPGHTIEDVNKIINLINNGHFLEVRSFDSKTHEESGLMVFKEKIILNNNNVSVYIGAINADVKEIHRKEDLNG